MTKKSGFCFSAILLLISIGLVSLTHRTFSTLRQSRSYHSEFGRSGFYPPAFALPGFGGTQNTPGVKASIERGKKVYAEQCLSCHQVDALGVSGMTPPLVKTKWVLGDKTKLVQIVLKGLVGEIEIDGDTYHNVMAPQSELSNQQIADVLTYIRNNFGNRAKPITAGEVAAIRAKTK